MLSWIQNHILLELTRYKTRRYSELRPHDVEGNLFMYHLKSVMKTGLVEKHENSYRLSRKGMQYAAKLSLKTGRVRLQPKILTAVIAKNERGEHLFIRWHRQPNTDLVSFPYGLVHYGKSMVEMAALELAEKAGLEARFTHSGDVYVRVVRDGEVDRHMLVHLFKASDIRPGRQGELRPELCESFWARLGDVANDQFVPGFYEIAQLAEGPISGLQEIIINDKS